MYQLELTEEKAKELNKICEFAIDKGVMNVFGINYYQKNNPQFDVHYYSHLIDVAKQYDNINKLIDLSANSICATHNTSEFIKSGGFLRILKIEQREEDIQDFTRKNLRQSIFATKDWWLLFAFTLIVTAFISIITSLSTDKLLKRNSPQMPTQDSLLKSLTTYILHLDSLNLSYKDSLIILKKATPK